MKKKREISRIHPNDQLIHTRPPSNGAPNPQFHFPKSPLTKEIGRQKKVKFTDSGKKESPRTSCRLERDYSHMQPERENVTTCDAKTSEYAFFKKLKKDASLKFPSGPLKKVVSLSSKKPESGDCSKERTNNVGIGRKGYNSSSRIIQDVSTFKTDSFLSPSGGAWNMSDLHSISSMPRNSHGCGGTLKPQDSFSHEGNRYVHGEIFSRKRQKLRQCVADAVFPDMENLCSKGHDIVSMLLNRLLPMGTVKNKYKDSNPGKVETATRYDLLDSRDSKVQLKEQYQIPKRKLLELESDSYFNDQLLPPPMFLRSDERTTQHAEFPTYDHHSFQPPYSIRVPECKLSGTPSFSAFVKGDLSLELLSNQVSNATRYSLHDSRELDVHFTEHHQIPKRKLLELESSSYFSDHLLSPMHLKPVELITSHADFPIYPHEFQPVSRTEAESIFGGSPSFVYKNDVTHGFLCNEQKHETFALNHFEELGKLEREPIPLLEKDFNCTKDEMKLPVTCKYAKPDMAALLSILSHGEEQISNNALAEYHFSPSSLLLDKPEEQISNSALAEYHFSPSSLLLDKPQDFNSVLDSGLLRYQEFRFGKYVSKDYEDMDMNFNHKALLSFSNNKHKLSDNCKIDTSFVQDSMYLSPFQHWFRKAVSNDHHPHSDAWLPSSLDECQRCLISSPSDSKTLQLPQRESMSSLFHIDNNCEPEIDGGNPGEVLYHFSKDFIEMYNSSFVHLSMQRHNGWPFSLNDSDNITEGEQTHEMLL